MVTKVVPVVALEVGMGKEHPLHLCWMEAATVNC